MRDITGTIGFFNSLRRGNNGATSSPGSDRQFTAVGAGFLTSDVDKFLVVQDADTTQDNGVYQIVTRIDVDNITVDKGFPEGGLSDLDFLVPRRVLDAIDPTHEYLVSQLNKYTPKSVVLQGAVPVVPPVESPQGKYYLLEQYDSDTTAYVQFDKESGLPDDVVNAVDADEAEGRWVKNTGYRAFELGGRLADLVNFGSSTSFFTGITTIYAIDVIVDIPYLAGPGTVSRKAGTDDLSSDNDTFRILLHQDGTVRALIRLVGTNTELVGIPILYDRHMHIRLVVDQTGGTGDKQRLYIDDMSTPVVTTDVGGTIPITSNVDLDFGISVATEAPELQLIEFMASKIPRANQVL